MLNFYLLACLLAEPVSDESSTSICIWQNNRGYRQRKAVTVATYCGKYCAFVCMQECRLCIGACDVLTMINSTVLGLVWNIVWNRIFIYTPFFIHIQILQSVCKFFFSLQKIKTNHLKVEEVNVIVFTWKKGLKIKQNWIFKKPTVIWICVWNIFGR